jgi:hypothetical protein
MKVLKLKDPTKFKKLLTKRQNNMIIPFPDIDGNYIVPLDVLVDPNYEDIVEDILDLCEIFDFSPLIPEVVLDKSLKPKKGEFESILTGANSLEEAVILYYDNKK